MKRYLPLILAGICCSTYSTAQLTPALTRAELARKQLATFCIGITPPGAAKGAVMVNRLSKQVDFNDYGSGNAISDSTRFMYSGARHSNYDYNSNGYISMYNLNQAPTTDFQYVLPSVGNTDSFLLSHVSFDSLLHYALDSAGTPLRLAHSEARIYNSDGSINTATTRTFPPGGGAPVAGFRQVVLYNGSRISKVYFMKLNGVSYTDTTAVRYLAYDVAGNAVLDSTAVKSGTTFRPGTRTTYTYNASGAYLTRTIQQYNTGSLTFGNNARYTRSYYADGKVKTSLTERTQTPGGALVPMQLDSFAYTPGVAGYTTSTTQGYPAGALSILTTNHYATPALKDSMTYSNTYMGTTSDIFSYKISYNTDGTPASIVAYDIQTPAHDQIFSTYFSYEQYDNTAVRGQTQVKDAITLSPNPTNGRLSLNYAGVKQGMQVVIRIADAAGNLVHAEVLTVHGSSQEIMLGEEAVPGTYYLSVVGDNNVVLCRQAVVKL